MLQKHKKKGSIHWKLSSSWVSMVFVGLSPFVELLIYCHSVLYLKWQHKSRCTYKGTMIIKTTVDFQYFITKNKIVMFY